MSLKAVYYLMRHINQNQYLYRQQKSCCFYVFDSTEACFWRDYDLRLDRSVPLTLRANNPRVVQRLIYDTQIIAYLERIFRRLTTDREFQVGDAVFLSVWLFHATFTGRVKLMDVSAE